MKKYIFLTFVFIIFGGATVFGQMNQSGAEPITPELVLSETIRNNFDVFIASLENKIAIQEVPKEKSKFDTTFLLDGGYTHDESLQVSTAFPSKTTMGELNFGFQKLLPIGTDVEVSWNNSETITSGSLLASSTNPLNTHEIEVILTQPILKNFFGYIDRAEVKLVRLDVSKTDLATQDKIEQNIAEAKKAFYDLIYAYDFFNAKEEALAKAKEFLEINEKQLKTGLVEQTDYYAAKAEFHIKENEVLDARDNIQNASNNLKFVMNYFPNEILVPTTIEPQNNINQDLAYQIEKALVNRRDYQSKKIDIESAGIEIKISRQNRWPELDIEASYRSNGLDLVRDNAIREVYTEGSDEYFIGGTFSFPLENRNARADLKQKKLQEKIYLTELKKIEKQIQVEIDQSLRKIILEREKYEKNKLVTELQEKKFLEEEKKFKIGRSSSDLMIRYKNDWIDARIAESNAFRNLLKALIDLELSQNTLLSSVTVNNS